MKEVIIATKNRGKVKDFEKLFHSKDITVKTLLDFPEFEDIEETGNSFEENAVLKAEAVAKQLGCMVIADDSGLVVDALHGRPGIYSARYAGEEKSDDANIIKVLEELESVSDEDRSARFYCALAVASPNQNTVTVSGTCEGSILHEKRGTNGFGYDPIFFVKDKGLAMAELSAEEKNQISHRANALKQLSSQIDQLIVKEDWQS